MEEPRYDSTTQAPPPTGQPVYPTQPQYVPAGITPPQPEPRKQGKGYIVGIVAIVAICIVVIVSISSCTSMINGTFDSLGLSSTDSYESNDSSPKIGVISIDGTIQYDGTACSPSGLRMLLDQAEQRDDIKAVVLRIDSGGGTATAGEEMAHYVADFSKPIVVSSASTNASAAYEISSQADYIFTAKTTAIGAIGVALQVTDLSGLYDKLGINIENIVSAESKDSSYGTRPLTDEERAWYQELVDQIDADFVQTVADGRGLPLPEAKKLANGLTYTGMDAVGNGLADEIGYIEDAAAYASELAGFDKPLSMTAITLSSESNLSYLIDLLGQARTSDDVALKALMDRLQESKTAN